MNISDGNVDFYKKFNEIRFDMSKASLEDVKSILDHYNSGTITMNGANYHYNISPLEAASLNARYKELTGLDHPIFMQEQKKVLDAIIKSGEGIRVNGKPTIYQRLQNNLTGEGLGIDVLPNRDFMDKYREIKFDMSKASLEDVKEILDHYDQDSVLVNGVQYHFRPSALAGASLNARYKELAGEDHPTFLKAQEQILNEQIKAYQGIRVNGRPTVYQQLKNNDIEIGNHDHILNKTNEIILNPQEASLEDISSLLNYYNGKPVIIDGVAHHPFNDPMSAIKLNSRYHELTGKDHPTFVEQVPEVINEYLGDKESLLDVYGKDYFDKLEQVKQSIQQTPKIDSTEEAKQIFDAARKVQTQQDAVVRNQQIEAMNVINSDAIGMQQSQPEMPEVSTGGMSI